MVILSPPHSGHTAYRAVEFARCAIARGHSICRVFFFDAGAASGTATATYPQGEANPRDLWADLADKHCIELVLCITSALRNGVLDQHESERYGHGTSTMHPAFTLGGLGLLIEAADLSDRIITFAG